MIPQKDDQGNNIEQVVTLEQSIADIKDIFGDHFGASDLDFKKISKNIKRFLDNNAKWGRTGGASDKIKYYDFFSPENWKKLDADSKGKHTISCNECNDSFQEIHAKFPSSARAFSADRMKNPERAKVVESRKRPRVDCKNITNDLGNALDDSFSKLVDGEHTAPKKISKGACKDLTNEIGKVLDERFQKYFKTSFHETFKKSHKLEDKKSYEEKRNEKTFAYRETVKLINKDSDCTAVDRLYGGRKSLRGWDADRKKNHSKLFLKQGGGHLRKKLKLNVA